jgi:glycogen operon protein
MTPQGTEMTQADWALAEARFLAYVLAPIESSGVALYIILNAAPEATEIVLPKWPGCSAWTRILATAVDDDDAGDTKLKVGTKHLAPAQSVTVFAGTTS